MNSQDFSAGSCGGPLVAEIPGLVGLCIALGVDTTSLSTPERRLLADVPIPSSVTLEATRAFVLDGQDPLGDWYCALVTPEERRPRGQTYTPRLIVDSMIRWASTQGMPSRVVDPGAGSGRYVLAALKAFPDATGVALDVDPIACLMQRANAAVLGIGDRCKVVLGDYREMQLPDCEGSTLIIGNPPYVRHHQIDPKWKRWLASASKAKGLSASGLAGLHAHFFLATAGLARPGDLGAFITSSEWLDVNYGKLIRDLLLGELGGVSLHVLDPTSMPFSDANVTGTITCFRVGDAPTSIRIQQVKKPSELGSLNKGRLVSRHRLQESNRWSTLTRVTPKLSDGFVELGEIARVHRGAVTGANKTWVTSAGETDLPSSVLFPSVTKARELFASNGTLTATEQLRLVIDLPVDLGAFPDSERSSIQRFLKQAKSLNVDRGYIASTRRAWWSVGLRSPAPLLATYMARRPPAFVRNLTDARHINIAHGIYPRVELGAELLDALAVYLRTSVTLGQGRTYAGGLTKFEPKEMERIPVPTPDMLSQR